jgi:hypothetical protein
LTLERVSPNGRAFGAAAICRSRCFMAAGNGELRV